MDGLDQMIEYIQHKQRLVSANRILAREGVDDAFGHVSIRNMKDAKQYTMSRSRSPELVEFEDLMDFTLEGNAIDPRERV